VRLAHGASIIYKSSLCTLQIVATETRTTQRFSSTATVQLQILDVNDNRPVFNQSGYAFTIPENSPINTFVGRVKATDADSGAFGTVSYALDGTDAFKFRINSTTGDIFVNVDADKNLTLLDRERFSTIFLTIEGRDGGGFVTAVQMEILLSDQNDQAPVFTRLSYFGVVKENSFTFDSPVQVEAADNDLKGSNNSIVEYRIIGGDLGGNFNIVSTSGLLMIRTPLNYESLPSSIVNLTISAYDLGVPSLNSSINVQVTVLDQNDNSPICTYALFNATVMENATSGTQILQVNATDADPPGSENSRVFFRIQTGAADKFTIDGNTGWIVVERGADLDVTRYGSRYNLSIIVYDNGTPQRNGTCIAVIFVRDVNNQRPYFEVPTRRETVQENLSLNQPLPITPQFTAKDPDTTSNLQYSILFSQMSATEGNGQQVSVSNYNYTDLLYVSSTNGTLFVKNILDREKAQEIRIPIFVQDLAAETPLPVQTATGTLIITLSDLNDESPVFQLPAVNNTYRITVSEGLRPPTDISLKALATDPDTSNPPLVYSISPPSTIFSIDTNTAQVSLKTALDRETADQHQFFVLVNDSIHITTATVYVNVSDFNDVTPSFYQFASNLSISEATSVGSLLTRVLAYDNDTGLFGTVHYRILSGGGGKFALNDTSGELRLGQALDRDVPGGEEYSLLIEAFDNPGSADSLRTSRAMMISVLDVNDNPPRFAQDNFTITSLLESMDSNQLIREISATDADTGVNAQISFSLRAIPGQNSDALNLFFVTTKQSGSVFSAAIWTRKSLTRAVGWYNLTLLATDAGTPTMTGSTNLTFFIADVNDHSPVFVYPNQTQTVIQVNESTNASSTIGKPLLVAKAIDQDYGNNTIVRFDLTSSNGDNAAFNIDAVSGLLTVATNLNREVKSEYRFSIKAYDLGVPPLTTMVNIVVQVLDVDESPPVFGPDSRVQQLSVPENSVPSSLIPGLTISGVRVGSIAKASDPDVTDKSTPICYFMLDPVYYLFYLNKTSGDLYVLSALDREAAPQYNLHVIAVGASQCNSTAYEWKNATNHRVKRYLDTTPIAYNPNNATMALIVVNVGDVNDNPPVWKNSIYYGGVRVTDPPSTTVFNFAEFVTDADIGNNSLLTFGMTGPTPDNQKLRTQLASREILDSVFTLDNRTGVLKTGDKTYFQETMTGAVSFNVTASDSKYLATTMCTIYLLSLEQQLIVVMSGVPANATRIRDAFVSYLSNITGWRIVVDNIVTHKNDDGTADNSKTDMYIHAINLKDNSIVPAATVRDKVDLLWPEMVAIYKTFGVLQVKLASQPASSDSILEIMRIALIVVACSLAILLFFACVSLWSCRRMYRRKLKAATAVAFGTNGHSNAPRTPGTNMHTYEGSNPIWLEAYNMNQYDNKNFESSDKGDSIDSSQMEPADQQIEMRFDEVEKTMEFLNDNISESGSTNFRNSREMLSSAVDAGPDILAEPTPGPGDDGLAPVNLNGVPATSI
uniref:Cadherin domain-containing protein n=1 Tax=Macrostomum lignano TaxID=282301 RepID=A0A1I8H1P8_9PLAT